MKHHRGHLFQQIFQRRLVFTLSNGLSFARLLSGIYIYYLIQTHRVFEALIFIALAIASDFLDGYFARKQHQISELGKILDPLADKFLLVSCYLSLAWMGALPGWLVLVVVGRDLVILFGAVAYHYRVEPLSAAPTAISKLNTLAQLLLVLAVLFERGVMALPPGWLETLIYVVLATTLLSGFDYVWTWGWRAWNKRHGTGRFP